MASSNEIKRRLKKIGYKFSGIITTHYEIWNCPCKNDAHPVHVGRHPSKEDYFKGYKKQLGPHAKEFGKI